MPVKMKMFRKSADHWPGQRTGKEFPLEQVKIFFSEKLSLDFDFTVDTRIQEQAVPFFETQNDNNNDLLPVFAFYINEILLLSVQPMVQ